MCDSFFSAKSRRMKLGGKNWNNKDEFKKIRISTIIRSVIGNEELIKKLLTDEEIKKSLCKIAGSEESEKFLERVFADENVGRTLAILGSGEAFNDFFKVLLGNEDIQKSAAKISKTEEFRSFTKVLNLKDILGIE